MKNDYGQAAAQFKYDRQEPPDDLFTDEPEIEESEEGDADSE